MDPRKLFVDERLVGCCAYCGGKPNTRDHVPSRIFLDEPFPANLPVVDACMECNNKVSSDEQYVASVIDCILVGSSEPCLSHREKIRRTLEQRPALRLLIDEARKKGSAGEIQWVPDEKRVTSVLLKLARGHVAYEFSEACLEAPKYISSLPLCVMSNEEIRHFEEQPSLQAWPEIGSRAFLRVLIGAGKVANDGWLVVQEARYRYQVNCSPSITVKLVLSEYLACEIRWCIA